MLKELVDLYSEKADSDLLIGSILRGGEPVRDQESKYFISEEEYPHARFPAYPSGGGFVFSRKTAKSLHSQLTKMRPISVDDALIGLAMNKLGLSGS